MRVRTYGTEVKTVAKSCIREVNKQWLMCFIFVKCAHEAVSLSSKSQAQGPDTLGHTDDWKFVSCAMC